MAVVDLNRMEVVRVDDHGVVPIPAESGDYRSPEGGFREQAPIRITQPDGVSFALDGNEVTWQRWRFRLGFTAREALVLHDIAYRDGDEWRPVCHRASIAELVIPYGDPAPTTHYKNAFDVGEYGMGAMANALELGCDCLGEIRFRAPDLVELARRADAHERTPSACTRRTPASSGSTSTTTAPVEVRRARRFVASCICTVGNYEYGYYWYLGQDGSLAFEVKLTGILHTTAVEPGTGGPHSTEVAPRSRRAVPPALPVRAAGHGRRRPGQPPRRGRVGSATPRRTPETRTAPRSARVARCWRARAARCAT